MRCVILLVFNKCGSVYNNVFVASPICMLRVSIPLP